MQSWIAFWNILKKDIKNYYLKPPNISWGIIFPLAWALMQFIRSGGLDIIEFLPGLMSMSVLFGTTSMLAVTITFERKGRSFERLLLAPINISTMVTAKIAGAIIFGMLNAFVPVVIAAFLVDLSAVNWWPIVPAIFLIAVTSTLMGLIIAVSAKEVFEAQTFSNFFRFPMLFLCGLFIPLKDMPVFLLPLSYCLPLTYGTDILNGAIASANIISPFICFPAMIAFAALLFTLCWLSIKKKWIM